MNALEALAAVLSYFHVATEDDAGDIIAELRKLGFRIIRVEETR